MVFAGRRVTVGTFRCSPTHPNFENEGKISGYEFVFPRTAVWIQHSEGRPFVADPATVTLYHPGQEYRRHPLDPRGDHGDWFSVDQAMAVEAASLFEKVPEAANERSWRCTSAPGEPRTYLRQRLLLERLERWEGQERSAEIDDLQIEETVADLLVAVLATAYGAEGAGHRWPTVASQDRVLNRTRALLAVRFHEPLGLIDVAKAVGSSTFHLSRLFRRATGVTLHQWRHRLRLHAALEAIARPASGHDLTGIALDLGFSSHSHFTAAFRTAFGKPPSAIRRSDAARLAKDLAVRLRAPSRP